MSNELNIALDPVSQSGLTVIARLYASGAQVGTDIALTEVGSTAFYSGDAPSGLSAGSYVVSFHDDSDDALLGTGELHWDGSSEMTLRNVGLTDEAITAAKIAGDAVTKIQNGLATAGADGDTLETLSDQLDQVKAAIAARSPLPVNSPESAGAILETVRGDDHTDDSPHGAYVWDAPASTWGDLSSATIKFTSRRASDDVAEIDGYSAGFSVLDAGTEDQKVKLELPASETSKLTPGANGAKLTNKFDVQVTRADDVTFTLARGVPPLGGHTIYEDQTRDESS